MTKKILGKGSITVTTIDDAFKAYSSAQSLVISCNAEQTQFELGNAKTAIFLTVGNKQLTSDYYQLSLIDSVIDTDQVSGTIEIQDRNFVAITSLTSKKAEGEPSTNLILGKIQVKVTLTEKGRIAYPGNADYEEVIEIPWNTLQSGSSGYTVKLSRGNNCVIYSDSIDAEVPQVQLDTLVNQVTVTKIDYTLDPVLSMDELAPKKFFVEVVNPTNCEVEVVAGNSIIVKNITTGNDGLQDKNAVAQYTINVYCENSSVKYPETVVITKILPKEDLYIAGDQAFIYGNNFIGNATPDVIKLTATSKWSSSKYEWAYAIAGSDEWVPIEGESRFEPSDSAHRTLIVYPTSSEWSSGLDQPKIVNVTYRVTANGTSDYKTLFKVSGGSDSYTNYLTNSNATVACEVDGTLSNPLQMISTGLRVFRGSTEFLYWAPDASNPDDVLSNHVDRFTITPSDLFDITDQGTVVVPAKSFTNKDVTEIPINFVCYGGYVGTLTLTVTKAYRGKTGAQGEHALAIGLSNDSFLLHCDNTGTPLEGALVNNECYCSIYKGDDDISANNLANDAGKVCEYEVVIEGASVRDAENPTGDIELLEYEGCPNRKVIIHNIDGEAASINWSVRVTNELTGHVSRLSKSMTVTKVCDGRVGDIASVNYLNVSTAFIAQSVNSQGARVLNPAAYTAYSIASGNDNTTDDLPITIEACDTDGALIANILPINGTAIFYDGRINVNIDGNKVHENVKLIAVTSPEKYLHIFMNDYENVTDNFDMAFPTVSHNTDAFTIEVDSVGNVVAPETFKDYRLYSARLRGGKVYFESGSTFSNYLQVSNTYYSSEYNHQVLKLWSSRIETTPTIRDQEQIAVLHKDWTDINVRITPSSIGIPATANGTPIDYAGCEASISVITKDLDITDQCDIQPIGNADDVSVGFCGIVEGNGTFLPKYKITHVPSDKQSGNDSGITITYGGVTQRYYIPWHLEKQGLSGSSSAFAGQWNGNRTYKVRHNLRTVVFVYSDESKKNKSYYWTKEIDASQGTIEIPLNVDPASEEGKAYWDEFDGEFQSVATGFLFAEDSYITGLTSARIYIGDEFECDENGNWIYPRVPVLDEEGNQIYDENGAAVTELGKDPIQSMKGWVLDKDVIRSRGTVPMVSSDGKSMVTYMAHYDPTAANPFLVNGMNRQPATILYSDGGIITNKGQIGAWTLNEEALFTSVPFKTGFRKVIGMNITEIWKHNTTGKQSSPNASKLIDETPLPTGSGESLLETDEEVAPTPEVPETDAPVEGGESTEEKDPTAYDPATERYNWTATNATRGTRYAFFAQSPNYLRREDDGKYCQIIDVALHYTDEHNFGLNASLYDDQKNQEVKEYFFLGSKSYRNQTTGLEEVSEGGRIAGWMFEDSMIHKDWNKLYLGTGGGWVSGTGSNVITEIPNQRVAMYQGNLNSGYSSGFEVYGGNIYLGKKDIDDQVRKCFFSLPTGSVSWEVTDDATGEKVTKTFDKQLIKPEYLMRFGYDTTCLVKKWDPNANGGEGAWVESPEYVYDEQGNILKDDSNNDVVVGSPIFRIARYEFEDQAATETDEASGMQVKSKGKYYDLFKVDKAGPVFAGWSITREALYNRGVWKEENWDKSRAMHGAYEYMMVSGADKGLPILRIQGSKSDTEIPLDPATGLPAVDEEGMYVGDVATGGSVFTASVSTGIEQYTASDGEGGLISGRSVFFRIKNDGKAIMSIDWEGNRLAGWWFDDLKLFSTYRIEGEDFDRNKIELRSNGSIINYIINGGENGTDVAGWYLKSDGSAEFAGGGVKMTYDPETHKSYVTFGNNAIANIPNEAAPEEVELNIWYDKTFMRPSNVKASTKYGTRRIRLQGLDSATNALRNATLLYANNQENDTALGVVNSRTYDETKSNPCIYIPSTDLSGNNGEVELLWFYDKPTSKIVTTEDPSTGEIVKTLDVGNSTEGDIILQYYTSPDALNSAFDKNKLQISTKIIHWTAKFDDSMIYMVVEKQHYWNDEPVLTDTAALPVAKLKVGQNTITSGVTCSIDNLDNLHEVTIVESNGEFTLRPSAGDNSSIFRDPVNTPYASFDVVLTYNGFKYVRTVKFDVHNDPIALTLSKDAIYVPVDSNHALINDYTFEVDITSLNVDGWVVEKNASNQATVAFYAPDGLALDLTDAPGILGTGDKQIIKLAKSSNTSLTRNYHTIQVNARYVGLPNTSNDGKVFYHTSVITVIPVNIYAPGLDTYIKSDWINRWTDGITRVDGDSVMSPKIFAGKSLANGVISGVAIGEFSLNTAGTKTSVNGVVGIYENLEYFRLQHERSHISGWNFNESGMWKAPAGTNTAIFMKATDKVTAIGTVVDSNDIRSQISAVDGLGLTLPTYTDSVVKITEKVITTKTNDDGTVTTEETEVTKYQVNEWYLTGGNANDYHWYFGNNSFSLGRGAIVYDADKNEVYLTDKVKLRWSSVVDGDSYIGSRSQEAYPDWLKSWNGTATEITNDYIASPNAMIGELRYDEVNKTNSFYGVNIGHWMEGTDHRYGIRGMWGTGETFRLNATDEADVYSHIAGWRFYRGFLKSGNIVISSDDSFIGCFKNDECYNTWFDADNVSGRTLGSTSNYNWFIKSDGKFSFGAGALTYDGNKLSFSNGFRENWTEGWNSATTSITSSGILSPRGIFGAVKNNYQFHGVVQGESGFTTKYNNTTYSYPVDHGIAGFAGWDSTANQAKEIFRLDANSSFIGGFTFDDRELLDRTNKLVGISTIRSTVASSPKKLNVSTADMKLIKAQVTSLDYDHDNPSDIDMWTSEWGADGVNETKTMFGYTASFDINNSSNFDTVYLQTNSNTLLRAVYYQGITIPTPNIKITKRIYALNSSGNRLGSALAEVINDYDIDVTKSYPDFNITSYVGFTGDITTAADKESRIEIMIRLYHNTNVRYKLNGELPSGTVKLQLYVRAELYHSSGGNNWYKVTSGTWDGNGNELVGNYDSVSLYGDNTSNVISKNGIFTNTGYKFAVGYGNSNSLYYDGKVHYRSVLMPINNLLCIKTDRGYSEEYGTDTDRNGNPVTKTRMRGTLTVEVKRGWGYGNTYTGIWKVMTNAEREAAGLPSTSGRTSIGTITLLEIDCNVIIMTGLSHYQILERITPVSVMTLSKILRYQYVDGKIRLYTTLAANAMMDAIINPTVDASYPYLHADILTYTQNE